MLIISRNPIFDHLLESSHRDNSYQWSNIAFGAEINKVVSIEFYIMHLINLEPYSRQTCIISVLIQVGTKHAHFQAIKPIDQWVI